MNILSELYNNLIVTREYIKTLTLVASLLIRKYSHTQTEPSELIYKKQKDQIESIIVKAIKELIKAQKSDIIKVVQLLTKEYSDRLLDSNYNNIVGVLLNEVNISIFITLLLESKRDI